MDTYNRELGEKATCSWDTSDLFSGLNNSDKASFMLSDGNDGTLGGGDSSDGDNEEFGSEDHVLVYPRRKLGQEKMGSERPPVVVTREYLESNYDIPLTVVAKKLNISATVLKQLCRRVGIAKWPYKRRKATSMGSRKRESKKDNHTSALSTCSSTCAQEQGVMTQQTNSACFGQGAASSPGVPVVAYPAHQQEQDKAIESALPTAPRMMISHTSSNEGPAFSSSPTRHDHSAPLGNEFSAALPFEPPQFQLDDSRSPFPLELATASKCEIPEPAYDFNPDALRLASALWRRPAQCESQTV